ncbi:MAG: reductive dehalogenase [Candidatus Hermodarchaeia archaeon]
MRKNESYQQLLVGPIERFDQRREMFVRSVYEQAWIDQSIQLYSPERIKDKPGYRLKDFSLAESSWYVESLAIESAATNHQGLYTWEDVAFKGDESYPYPRMVDTSNPGLTSKMIKRAARFFGASLVGICELDRRWLYAKVYNYVTEEHTPLEIPDEFRFAISMAVEMDYDLIKTSPGGGAVATTRLGYSKMALVAGLVTKFIRNLGYQALPCGNDNALSIPIAIEAGLGELGRNGLLINEKYGPRVQILKVFTDLPLMPDQPRFFGVTEFCSECKKCAEHCPSKAISFEVRSTEAPTISNNPGVLKWPINPEKCYKFWIANRIACCNCIRVCPFNKKEGKLHDLARKMIKSVPQLNTALIWLDDLFGYGKQQDPSTFWDS